MRLIDADDLDEFTMPVPVGRTHNDRGFNIMEIHGYNKAVAEIKERAKTAYDLKSVLEQLEDEKSLEEDIKTFNRASRTLSRHWNDCVDICKEIVENGGK